MVIVDLVLANVSVILVIQAITVKTTIYVATNIAMVTVPVTKFQVPVSVTNADLALHVNL